MQQFILMLISLFLIGCSDNVVPSKNNCVTKVVLFWDNISVNEKKKILSQAFAINVNKDIQNNIKNIPIGELGTLNDYNWIYFIYDKDRKKCEEKVKYTTLSLKRYFDIIDDVPKYQTIKNISNKEINILQHQEEYNLNEELDNWLNEETKKQLDRENKR